MQKIEPEMKKLGYKIVAISPDRPELLAPSVKKNKLSYELYSDSDMSVAKYFNLAFRLDDGTLAMFKKYNIDVEEASGHKHHLLPVPAAFLVSAGGEVIFSHHNADYKVRLSNEELLKAAKTQQ